MKCLYSYEYRRPVYGKRVPSLGKYQSSCATLQSVHTSTAVRLAGDNGVVTARSTVTVVNYGERLPRRITLDTEV